MRFKNFQLGILKGKAEEDTTDTDEEPVKEQAGNKTGGTNETSQSTEGDTEALSESQIQEDSQPRPHGPLSELTVEPQDTIMDEEADVGSLFDESEEEVKIVEVTAEAAKPEEKEKEKEPPKEDEDDSFNNLFSNEEEEVNPLENLINALPDVTVRELLDDLREIKDLLHDGQQK